MALEATVTPSRVKAIVAVMLAPDETVALAAKTMVSRVNAIVAG